MRLIRLLLALALFSLPSHPSRAATTDDGPVLRLHREFLAMRGAGAGAVSVAAALAGPGACLGAGGTLGVGANWTGRLVFAMLGGLNGLRVGASMTI